MKSSVSLCIEQLEARETPSRTPLVGDAFLPPGVIHAADPPGGMPPPVQVGRDGSVAFLPPGLNHAGDPPGGIPPPVQVGRDGSVAFLPLGFVDPPEPDAPPA